MEVLICAVFKIKIFHLCHVLVIRVRFVLHSCCSYVSCVSCVCCFLWPFKKCTSSTSPLFDQPIPFVCVSTLFVIPIHLLCMDVQIFFLLLLFFFFSEINKFKFKDFVVALDSEDDIVDIFRCHALAVAKASLRHKWWCQYFTWWKHFLQIPPHPFLFSVTNLWYLFIYLYTYLFIY